MEKLKPIETAPLGKKILLYWNDMDGHFEDGRVYLNEESDPDNPKFYHVLFDGDSMNFMPTHWCEIEKIFFSDVNRINGK